MSLDQRKPDMDGDVYVKLIFVNLIKFKKLMESDKLYVNNTKSNITHASY